MHAIATGFIAAGSYDAAAAHAANDKWFALQAAVAEAFDRDEEGVQIQMEYCPVVHGRNIRLFFDLFLVMFEEKDARCRKGMPDARLGDARLYIILTLHFTRFSHEFESQTPGRGCQMGRYLSPGMASPNLASQAGFPYPEKSIKK
jgi:hypothetical protein